MPLTGAIFLHDLREFNSQLKDARTRKAHCTFYEINIDYERLFSITSIFFCFIEKCWMLKRFCWDETRLEWKTAHHRGQMDDRTRDRDHNSITANKMWPSSAVWHAFANVCVCVCLIGSAWTHLAPWRWHQSTEENWRGWRESGDQAELPSRSVCPWWPARAYTHMHARMHTHTHKDKRIGRWELKFLCCTSGTHYQDGCHPVHQSLLPRWNTNSLSASLA